SKCTLPSVSANNVQSRPVPTFFPAMNLVPRCRTRMLPAVTNSPPNRFTPSLLLTLSRPLWTLPPPFLCAINSNFDFFDFHDRQLLTMPDGLMVAFSPFHLERDLLRAAPVFHDIRDDRGLGHRRRANRHLAVVIQEQNAVKGKWLAGFDSETFDFQRVTRGDSILLSTRFQYGIHKIFL